MYIIVLPVCMYVHHECVWTYVGQKKASGDLELELQINDSLHEGPGN